MSKLPYLAKAQLRIFIWSSIFYITPPLLSLCLAIVVSDICHGDVVHPSEIPRKRGSEGLGWTDVVESLLL